jgi:hypothetical protein
MAFNERLHGWGLGVGLALLTLASLPALAGLGEDVASVQKDRVAMKAQTRTSTAAVGYSVEQMQLPSGTVLNEYVSPEGKVFAISWHGPAKPDLRQAFGSYFQQYTSAARQAPRNPTTRRHFQIRQPDLVVESGGRMRAFYGRSYVPSLMPANVTADDIR